MESELQMLADSLAAIVGRSVAIDDRNLQLLAYSEHRQDIDPVRMASILHRQAPDEVKRWVSELGLRHAEGPTRVPANAAFEMEARICIPVRSQQRLLGYVWIIDADRSVDAALLDKLTSAIPAAVDILLSAERSRDVALTRERRLERELFDLSPEIRERAAHALLEEQFLAPIRAVTVLLVGTEPAELIAAQENASTRLTEALGHVRRTLPPRESLAFVRGDHGVVIACATASTLGDGGLPALAARLRDSVASALDVDAAKVLVGVSGSHAAVADVHLGWSEAKAALTCAAAVQQFRPVASWDDIGIYRALLRVPPHEIALGDLHESLPRFLEAATPELVHTLDVYLDLAGDAKATVDALHLHRASLYYRLKRVEELIGGSLRDGELRLAYGLGLKLARLQGVFPAVENGATVTPRER